MSAHSKLTGHWTQRQHISSWAVLLALCFLVAACGRDADRSNLLDPEGSTSPRLYFGASVDAGASFELWSLDLETRRLTQLTSAPESFDYLPSLSPAGTELAFTRRFQSDREIWVISTAGGAARRLIAEPGFAHFYTAWSPSGDRIAFSRCDVSAGFCADGDRQIWAVSPDGQDLEQLSPSPSDNALYPSWSPTGDRLVYSRQDPITAQMRVRELDLATGTDRMPFGEMDIHFPVYSPDGSRIVGTEGIEGDLFVTGTQLTRLTSRELWYTPAWSPDGTKIAAALIGELWLLDAATGERLEPVISDRFDWIAGIAWDGGGR